MHCVDGWSDVGGSRSAEDNYVVGEETPMDRDEEENGRSCSSSDDESLGESDVSDHVGGDGIDLNNAGGDGIGLNNSRDDGIDLNHVGSDEIDLNQVAEGGDDGVFVTPLRNVPLVPHPSPLR